MASRISRAVSTRTTSTPNGAASAPGPVTSVTSAPRSHAARASACPIFPEERFPTKRTASSGSRVGPEVTSTLAPERVPQGCTARPTASTMADGSAIRPGPLPSPAARRPVAGPTRWCPGAASRRARFARVLGWANILSFMAGANTTGASLAVNTVPRRSLARPDADRARKSAVAGATHTQSASRPRAT